MIIVIKNFNRFVESGLTAFSIKKKFPNIKIVRFDVGNVKDTIVGDFFDQFFDEIIYRESKYKDGDGCCSANNGLYFSEGLNYIFEEYQDKKVLVLDESSFCVTGLNIQEVIDNKDKDLVWCNWEAPGVEEDGVAGNFIFLNFKNLKNFFPLNEYKQYIEVLLKEQLIDKVVNKYKMKTRIYTNFFNDGEFVNDVERMIVKLFEYKVLQ